MPTGPYQLTDTIPGAPTSASPGVCYFCGSGQQQYQDERYPAYEPALDLMTNVDHEGFLYACMSCVMQWVALLGMESAEKVDAVKKENRRLGRRNQVLQDKLAQAVAQIHTLTAITSDDA